MALHTKEYTVATWSMRCSSQGTFAGVTVGCFPDLYSALSSNPPEQVITL
jgi:putative lipoic acid-binding regulatory protein